jgi:hypothetical protein
MAEAPAPHHYDPLVDAPPKRRRKGGMAAPVIVSIVIHGLLGYYIYKSKFEPKYKEYSDEAVKVDIVKPPPPPPPPPPPAFAVTSDPAGQAVSNGGQALPAATTPPADPSPAPASPPVAIGSVVANSSDTHPHHGKGHPHGASHVPALAVARVRKPPHGKSASDLQERRVEDVVKSGRAHTPPKPKSGFLKRPAHPIPRH